ncbi:MAG: T9SS type A sorting domain-containing protein, partial [Bacteroidales bacterium]
NHPEIKDTSKQIGLIAQEVQPIVPEVVTADTAGIYYIDYGRLVPVLVGAIKEMNTTNQQKDSVIGNLNDRLTQLEALVTQCCNAGSKSLPGNPCLPAGRDNDNGNDNDKMNIYEVELANGRAVVLDQNVPNPFAENTTITYFIPDDVASAQIIFTDNTGRILKTIDINEKGKGMLKVYAQDLSSGIYSYTLVADGKTIDSKKMIKAGN